MTHVYFVSYSWASFNGKETGYGSCRVWRDRKLKTWDDIKEVQHQIENKFFKNNTNVVILNYQKIKK